MKSRTWVSSLLRTKALRTAARYGCVWFLLATGRSCSSWTIRCTRSSGSRKGSLPLAADWRSLGFARTNTVRRLKVRFRVRSLMLVVAVVAAIAWSGVMIWRRSQLLDLSRRFRADSAYYAQKESLQLDSIGDVERLEREVAATAPPAAGADSGARWLYREHVSDLRARLEHARRVLLCMSRIARCGDSWSGSRRNTNVPPACRGSGLRPILPRPRDTNRSKTPLAFIEREAGECGRLL